MAYAAALDLALTRLGAATPPMGHDGVGARLFDPGSGEAIVMQRIMTERLQICHSELRECAPLPLSESDAQELQSMLMQLNWLCDLLEEIVASPANPSAVDAASRLLEWMFDLSQSPAVRSHVLDMKQRLDGGDARRALRIAETLRGAAV